MTIPAKRMTLKEFARRAKNRGCPVCQLPTDIRTELAHADDVPWRVRVQWVKDVTGKDISPAQGISHVNGRHDVS